MHIQNRNFVIFVVFYAIFAKKELQGLAVPTVPFTF